MTQLQLESVVQVPKLGTQLHTLLLAFMRGEKLTVLTAIDRYRCYALSQRCGELKRSGWPIKSDMLKLPSGKRVARYWIEA